MRLDEHRARIAGGLAGRPAAARRPLGRPATDAPARRLVAELVDPLHAVRVAFLAGEWNVAPLEAALALGLTTDDAIAGALAARLGASIAHLDGEPPLVAADPQAWRDILARGMVGVSRPVGGKALLVAPGPEEAERMAAEAGRIGIAGLPLLVATPHAFARLVRKWAEEPWVGDAISMLAAREPALSASSRRAMRGTAAAVTVTLAALFAALAFGPDWLALAAGGAVSLLVAAWVGLRLAAAALAPSPLPRRALGPAELPRYTILCALYREAAATEGLLAALGRIDYPRARLDIKLVLEADDPETLAAVGRVRMAATTEVIVVPNRGPRTKPKALMLALPFVAGDFVVVYDAEDRPDPGQLREAAETFAAADPRLGCLQAPLAIANVHEGVLARIFAAEYDALFRVLLPALAQFDLPMPLGGTSNHFRRKALDESLGWDPYNVTEDADLGFRLARRGWRTGTIAAPTLEEAPAAFGDWLRQRSRWFKGWMQTLAVLLRSPRRLAADLGWRGVLVLSATLAGSLGSALVHLTCLVALAVAWCLGGPPSWAAPAAAVFAFGYAGSIVYKAKGLRLAKRPGLLPWLLLLPFVWLAMGLAALKAVADLWRRPFHWEKTPHGAGRWRNATAETVSPAPPEALQRIVALSEAALASGRHSPREVAAALRRQCLRWGREGTSPTLLAVVEAYGREVESRGRSA